MVRIRYVLLSILMHSSDRLVPVSENVLDSSASSTYRVSGINRKSECDTISDTYTRNANKSFTHLIALLATSSAGARWSS